MEEEGSIGKACWAGEDETRVLEKCAWCLEGEGVEVGVGEGGVGEAESAGVPEVNSSVCMSINKYGKGERREQNESPSDPNEPTLLGVAAVTD